VIEIHRDARPIEHYSTVSNVRVVVGPPAATLRERRVVVRPVKVDARTVGRWSPTEARAQVARARERQATFDDGESQATLISAILSVPYQSNSVTPPALDRVIRTCLAKDPDDRWTNTHDVGLQLQGIADAAMVPGDEKAVSIGHRIRGPSWRAPWTDRLAAAAAALALGTAAWVFWPTRVERPSATSPPYSPGFDGRGSWPRLPWPRGSLPKRCCASLGASAPTFSSSVLTAARAFAAR